MAFPRDPTPITEAMIVKAIKDEEELEQTNPSEILEYQHYVPTAPERAEQLRLSFYSKNV